MGIVGRRPLVVIMGSRGIAGFRGCIICSRRRIIIVVVARVVGGGFVRPVRGLVFGRVGGGDGGSDVTVVVVVVSVGEEGVVVDYQIGDDLDKGTGRKRAKIAGMVREAVYGTTIKLN